MLKIGSDILPGGRPTNDIVPRDRSMSKACSNALVRPR